MSSLPDLSYLLSLWEVSLRADHRSAATIDANLRGVRLFIRCCEGNGHEPNLSRALVRAWIADLLAGGAQGTTARARQQALRRFSAWPAEEGEIDADPLLGLRSPAIDTTVVDPLSEDELRLLIKACAGKDFVDRRDEAVVRLMAETALRAGEVLALSLGDVRIVAGTALVRRGKGGRGRLVPFGPQTGRAIDRYLRKRRI